MTHMDCSTAVQVKKHHDKIEAEREKLAIEKLQASVPRLCKKVLALALHDCRMDADRALMLLRQFQADNYEALEALVQKHKAPALEQKPRSRRAAGDGAHADSDDDASDHERDRHKRSKSKKKEEKKSKRKKDGKKEKKRRRHASEDGRDGDTTGTWGIIRESDYSSKKAEFLAWAMEVKRVDVESLPRGAERELFRSFLEDYNTGSMPHDKYYDLDIYERKKAAKAAKRSGRDAADAGERKPGSFLDDEKLRKAELLSARQKVMDDNAHQAYTRLMMTGEHLRELKEREMLRLQMQDAYKTGDMDKAKRLMKKLNPDENDEERNPLMDD